MLDERSDRIAVQCAPHTDRQNSNDLVREAVSRNGGLGRRDSCSTIWLWPASRILNCDAVDGLPAAGDSQHARAPQNRARRTPQPKDDQQEHIIPEWQFHLQVHLLALLASMPIREVALRSSLSAAVQDRRQWKSSQFSNTARACVRITASGK